MPAGIDPPGRGIAPVPGSGMGNPWGTNPWGIGPSNWWIPRGTLSDATLNNDPQSAYQRFLLGQGHGENQSSQDRWYTQQYNRQFQNYNAMMANPGQDTQYRFLDFLKDYGGGLASQFGGLSANQRGERVPPWQRLRWLS